MKFEYIMTAIASVGLVLATASFISGLQLVRGTRGSIEGMIHRFNGYISLTLYITLTLLSFINSGFSVWVLLAWACGLGLILLKIRLVRRRRRRSFKYVSWLGASITLMWLYIVFIHIPL